MRKSCSGSGFDDVLPYEYERELIRRVQAGDASAEERLVRGYARLIADCIRRLLTPQRKRLEIDRDMATAGELAVVRAARRFDLSRGNKFFPYCRRFVELSVWTAGFDGFSASSLSPMEFRRAAMLRAAAETLGFGADIAELAEMAGIDEDRAAELLPAALAPHRGSLEWIGEDPAFDGDDPPTAEEAAVQSLTEFERDCADAVYAKVWTVSAAARRHGVGAEDVYDGARRAAEKLRAALFGPDQLELKL